MQRISRRTSLRRLALAFSANALGSAPFIAGAGDMPDEDEAAAIGKITRSFMEKYEVPGLSVAFATGGRIVHKAGFGMADKSAGEKMTPRHLFRIASISKPVTAIAIYKLIEEGKLKEDDRAFGALLQVKGLDKLPQGAGDITLRHLLTHTCGGWGNDRNDPMFLHQELDHADLIATTLREQPLDHVPGEHYAYSNFGYCLLGRVIEKTVGKTYSAHVREVILKPCGAGDMKIAGNTLADRAKGEVVYYGRNGEDPYGMNVRRMDAHGGWLATPEDIVRIFSRSCGTGTSGDLLLKETAAHMFAPGTANPGYAGGWSVNAAGHHWHGGSLPGTTTIAVRTASGLCWAGFANTRCKDINLALDQMMWQMAKAVPAWNA